MILASTRRARNGAASMLNITGRKRVRPAGQVVGPLLCFEDRTVLLVERISAQRRQLFGDLGVIGAGRLADANGSDVIHGLALRRRRHEVGADDGDSLVHVPAPGGQTPAS